MDHCMSPRLKPSSSRSRLTIILSFVDSSSSLRPVTAVQALLPLPGQDALRVVHQCLPTQTGLLEVDTLIGSTVQAPPLAAQSGCLFHSHNGSLLNVFVNVTLITFVRRRHSKFVARHPRPHLGLHQDAMTYLLLRGKRCRGKRCIVPPSSIVAP